MRLLILLLFSSLFSSVSAQHFNVDTFKLNNSYEFLLEHPSDKTAQELFFKAFPDSWPEFISTYAYSDDPEYNLSMYKRYANHCDAFINNLSYIDSTSYCEKLVELAIGARIDADAPNALRNMQHLAMQNRRENMLSAIRTLLVSDRILYWQFYWSSMLNNPNDTDEFSELYNQLINQGLTEDALIMERAFVNFNGKAATISSKHIGQYQFEGKDY